MSSFMLSLHFHHANYLFSWLFHPVDNKLLGGTEVGAAIGLFSFCVLSDEQDADMGEAPSEWIYWRRIMRQMILNGEVYRF